MCKYSNKRSKSAKRQHQIDCQVSILESLLARSLADGVSLLSKYIPSFKLLLSPLITSAIKLQDTIEENIITEVPTAESGTYQAQPCINASTSHFHCEPDTGLTLIYIPKREKKLNNDFRCDNVKAKRQKDVSYCVLVSITRKDIVSGGPSQILTTLH